MKTFVADTHAIVWQLTNPKRLGRSAKRAFDLADAARALCYVPAIALAEVTLLHERGRLRVGAVQVVETLAAHAGYSVLPIDIEQALEFERLVTIRDPMDRLIVAAASAVGGTLLSCDEALDVKGIARLWD